MSESMFTPLRGGGDWIKAKDFAPESAGEGHLLLILEVLDSWERWDELRNETSRAVKVNLVDLTTGILYSQVNWSDKYIVQKLEVGAKNILARIDKLAPKQKGWQGAIILTDCSTDSDSVKKAVEWINAQKPSFTGVEKNNKPAESIAAATPKPIDPLEEALR